MGFKMAKIPSIVLIAVEISMLYALPDFEASHSALRHVNEINHSQAERAVQMAKKGPNLPNDQILSFLHLEDVFNELNEAVKRTGGDARGTSIAGFPEQVDFYSRVATHPSIRTVCEVGFNAGYSTAVWLASNPQSKVISFDLRQGSWGLSCANLLQDRYPGRLEMHWGNSAESIPRFTSEHDVDDHHAGITCDLVHIDGDHSFEGAQADFQNFYPLMTCDSMILVDDVLDSNNGDTQNNGPTKLWHVLKGEGVVEETDSMYSTTMKNAEEIRAANHGYNKGFVLGRLHCSKHKPPLAAKL